MLHLLGPNPISNFYPYPFQYPLNLMALNHKGWWLKSTATNEDTLSNYVISNLAIFWMGFVKKRTVIHWNDIKLRQNNGCCTLIILYNRIIIVFGLVAPSKCSHLKGIPDSWCARFGHLWSSNWWWSTSKFHHVLVILCIMQTNALRLQ